MSTHSLKGSSGIHSIGATGHGFCFDNETPRHDALLHEHRIGNRLVTNSEYREFIKDGGYKECDLWLSDGWATINTEGWDRPLYWSEDLESEFTLGGQREIEDNAPVCHVEPSTRRMRSHDGPAHGCPPSSSGSVPLRMSQSMATCLKQAFCILCPAPTGSSSVTYGNGRHRHTRPTRASCPSKARWVNTTVSSCVTR